MYAIRSYYVPGRLFILIPRFIGGRNDLLAGAILTETIFAWPGVGKWLYDAVLQRDYMVIQGGTLFVAAIFVIINVVVDVLYAVINPKISVQ